MAQQAPYATLSRPGGQNEKVEGYFTTNNYGKDASTALGGLNMRYSNGDRYTISADGKVLPSNPRTTKAPLPDAAVAADAIKMLDNPAFARDSWKLLNDKHPGEFSLKDLKEFRNKIESNYPQPNSGPKLKGPG